MKRIFIILPSVVLLAVGCHSNNNQPKSENGISSSTPQVVVVTSPHAPAKAQPVPAQPYRFYTKGKTFTGGTYTNSTFGFSFNFPLDYSVTEYTSDRGDFYAEVDSQKTEQIYKDSTGEVSNSILRYDITKSKVPIIAKMSIAAKKAGLDKTPIFT